MIFFLQFSIFYLANVFDVSTMLTHKPTLKLKINIFEVFDLSDTQYQLSFLCRQITQVFQKNKIWLCFKFICSNFGKTNSYHMKQTRNITVISRVSNKTKTLFPFLFIKLCLNKMLYQINDDMKLTLCKHAVELDAVASRSPSHFKMIIFD